jgi:aerobic carbon-monoxide dehydrogenase medium subunit
VRPAPFSYTAPETVEEAVAALADAGPDAKALAGGQSLLAMMNFRVARPSLLVDLRRIPELTGISAGHDSVRVGAMTTHAEAEYSELLLASMPVVRRAVTLIGHPAIRNRGTVGGSLAHADPAAEWPVVALTLGARMRCENNQGSRWIDSDRFFEDYFETALGPEELITDVEIPIPRRYTGWSVQEFARQSGAFAIVLVVAVVRVGDDGRIEDLEICVGGCGGAPVRLESARTKLVGERPTDRVLEQAARDLIDDLAPRSDVHATSEDRVAIARALVKRALTEAGAARSFGGPNGGGADEV